MADIVAGEVVRLERDVGTVRQAGPFVKGRVRVEESRAVTHIQPDLTVAVPQVSSREVHRTEGDGGRVGQAGHHHELRIGQRIDVRVDAPPAVGVADEVPYNVGRFPALGGAGGTA